MTPAQKFAAWLGPAMRRAGLDIDTQQGGGRLALANALDVSRSTVSRWLEGTSMPSPEYYEPLAKALDVRATDMLVGAGIISPMDLGHAAPQELTVEEIAARWEISPEDLPILTSVVDELRKRSRRRLETGE